METNFIHIDTSSLTPKELSEEEFLNDLTNNLQIILDKEFKDNPAKQRIKKTTSSLNFACPFCHDSATDNKKKRGHLILTGRFAGRFKCFNCGQTMQFKQFFNKFDQSLSLSDISYISKEFSNEESIYNTSINTLTSNVINSEEAYKYAIPRDLIKTSLRLIDIGRETSQDAWNYLIGRCQYKHHERYLYSPQSKKILILNLIKDRVLGIQIRSIDPNYTGPKYLTLTIDKLRQSFYGDHSIVPDSIAKLSCIFNVFQVDFSKTYTKPVLVTEGPFDAFLLPNCIAIAGAAKNFGMNFPFWYIYDNDATGTEHALDALSKGYKVFMWKKFKEDYCLPNKKKWDVTDVMKYLRDHPTDKKLLWSPYFTNDRLNGLYL